MRAGFCYLETLIEDFCDDVVYRIDLCNEFLLGSDADCWGFSSESVHKVVVNIQPICRMEVK